MTSHTTVGGGICGVSSRVLVLVLLGGGLFFGVFFWIFYSLIFKVKPELLMSSTFTAGER